MDEISVNERLTVIFGFIFFQLFESGPGVFRVLKRIVLCQK